MNQQNDPLRSSRVVQQELERLYVESESAYCLDTDKMLDHLLAILPAEESRAVICHLEHCPRCTDTLIGLRRAFLPLLQLKQGWGGWRGAMLAAQGRMDAEMQRAWADLCNRDATSRQRTEMLRKALRWPWPTFTFASWAVTAILAVIVFGPFSHGPAVVPEQRTVKPEQSGDIPEFVAKGGQTETVTDAGLAYFQNVALPSREQLPHAIENWEKIWRQHPNLPAPPALLAHLYAQQYRQEGDPARRGALKKQMNRAIKAAQKNLQRLQEDVNARR